MVVGLPNDAKSIYQTTIHRPRTVTVMYLVCTLTKYLLIAPVFNHHKINGRFTTYNYIKYVEHF